MKIYKLTEEIKANDEEVQKALKALNDAHNKVKELLMHDMVLKSRLDLAIHAFKKEHTT